MCNLQFAESFAHFSPTNWELWNAVSLTDADLSKATLTRWTFSGVRTVFWRTRGLFWTEPVSCHCCTHRLIIFSDGATPHCRFHRAFYETRAGQLQLTYLLNIVLRKNCVAAPANDPWLTESKTMLHCIPVSANPSCQQCKQNWQRKMGNVNCRTLYNQGKECKNDTQWSFFNFRDYIRHLTNVYRTIFLHRSMILRIHLKIVKSNHTKSHEFNHGLSDTLGIGVGIIKFSNELVSVYGLPW